ncbi:hypothetical protein KCTC32516_00570 [Polaribacter huanghezhanensis]|uniref:hypothetical protein n=1 Tax=Polaribacter huanghezhanensis TaxID=1354726 RepID=UPI002648E757|nr:hypothetical protein [Polaribacter huanghezhanensis]WKD85230.1 hypothetical protein KCTC32516_00570 [Polaribacter huanghezhanensis]
MKIKCILFLVVIALITSCAVVPKESVELSATVGRDIVTVYKSHKDLATILFTRMKKDVNTFVDDVYAPYQIGKLLEADFADANSGKFESMTGAIIDAAKNSTDYPKQKQAIGLMKDFVSVVYNEVEVYRKILLIPIEKQELEVMAAIDRSYNQIIYANSIVIGHLASVRKVHDAQEEILNKFGLENLRTETAQKLSDYAVGVDKILKDVKKVDIDTVEKKMKEVQEKFNKLFKK